MQWLLLVAAFAASAFARGRVPQPAPAAPAPASAVSTAPASGFGPIVRPGRRTRRRRPRYKHGKPAEKAKVYVPLLKEKGWTPEAHKALEDLIAAKGAASKGYDDQWPPVAVFTLENVSSLHNPAEAAFLQLIERAEFRFSKAWWDLVPMEQRERAQLDYKHFSSMQPSYWPHDEYYLDWRKAMLDAYSMLCRRDGLRNCRAWLATLLIGPKEKEAEAYQREVLDEALRETVAEEPVFANAGDQAPVTIGRGVRRVPAIGELIRELRKAGFDVWMLSTSSQWMAEAFASGYGVEANRVVGVRVRIVNTVLQSELIDPVPGGAGMAEAVTVFMGRAPDLVVAGPEDRELLGYGKGLRIAIDRGDALLRARAKDRGWLLQPVLPPAPAEGAVEAGSRAGGEPSPANPGPPATP